MRAPSLTALASAVALSFTLPGAVAASAPSVSAVTPPAIVTPSAWTNVRAFAGKIGALSAAVDDDGHVHIAASAAKGLVYITDRGGTWAGKLVLANIDDGSYENWDVPSIALDEAGRVFIAAAYGCFLCAPGGTDGIWSITDRGHAPGTFGSPRKLAGTDATDPSLKVHDGHLYLAYGTVGRPGPGHTPVYLKTNATGSWTRTRIARDGYGPSLRVDSTGHARVALSGLDDVRYARAARSAAFSHVHPVPRAAVHVPAGDPDGVRPTTNGIPSRGRVGRLCGPRYSLRRTPHPACSKS